MFKFLKKFKDKILIALACSFIGIGTIFSNTLETKAYVSDEFSYTLSYDTTSGYSIYFNLNNSLTSVDLKNYYLCINTNLSVASSWAISSLNFNFRDTSLNRNISFNSSGSFYQNGLSTCIFDLTNFGYSSATFSSFYISISYGYPSRYISYSDIVNIDLLPRNDLTTSYYLDSYASQLQSQYDSLQVEYTAYQNTHAYTNEQYNNLMTQNATLTQQVLSLQSQYDIYVSLHSYTNEQYEILLNTYNNLQTMYNSLQHQYLDLQQEYNRLTIDLAPFRSAIWGNRQATLNGVSIDVSSSESLNSVVWFRDSYLQIDQREFENFTPYIDGENDFQLVTTSDTIVTINNYTAIANFAHNLDYGFSIEFYLNDSLVNTTMFFHGSMTTDDGGTTNTYNYIAPITFNKMIIDVVGGPGPSTWTESSYFKGNPGTWQQGYDYAAEQLMPRINILEDSLENAIAQQQVKYNEGYNRGISDSNSQPLYGMVIRIL